MSRYRSQSDPTSPQTVSSSSTARARLVGVGEFRADGSGIGTGTGASGGLNRLPIIHSQPQPASSSRGQQQRHGHVSRPGLPATASSSRYRTHDSTASASASALAAGLPIAPPLTHAALSALANAHPVSNRPVYPYPFAHHSFPARERDDTNTGRGGRQTNTPSTSTASDSDDERDGERDDDDDDDDKDGAASGATHEVDEEMRRWASIKAKGKGKEEKGRGMVEELPGEVLMQIFRQLDTRDLLSTLKVSKTWCLSAFPLLWARPGITSISQLASLVRVLLTPVPRLTLPYPNYVRRISLVALGQYLTDEYFLGLAQCHRVERLTLSGASQVSSFALRAVIEKMPDLVAVDLASTPGTDYTVLEAIGANCPRLHGLNLSGCKDVDANGVMALTRGCKVLRRIKLVGCHRQTDETIISLILACPFILELDLGKVPQLTDATLQAICLNCTHLREWRMNGNITVTDAGFLNMRDLEVDELAYSKLKLPAIPRPIIPRGKVLDHLRVVDLTGCIQLGDLAVDRLVTLAPRIRDLTLAKCNKLTDNAVESIARLGKFLHHLHLGHVEKLTDRSITKLARSCTRIRYLDLGCCPLMTDLSIFEIAANSTKLRRLGLVKMVNLSDDGLCALAERHTSLERVHLSYCNKITVWAMQYFLNRMMRLTHMSLTGVKAFKDGSLKQFSKPAPAGFNEHQSQSFCVYSGQGIAGLRHWLNQNLTYSPRSDPSSRRGSSSSASSITAPGNASPTGPYARVASAQEARYVDAQDGGDYGYAYGLYSDASTSRFPGAYVYESGTDSSRRASASAAVSASASTSTFRQANPGGRRASSGLPAMPPIGPAQAITSTGLESAFASLTPSFLNVLPDPAESSSSSRDRHRRMDRHRDNSGYSTWPRVPGTYTSGRNSRTSSISSVDTGRGNQASGSVNGGARQITPPQSAAAAIQAQYIAERQRAQARAALATQPGSSLVPGGSRQRAHTTSSPLALHDPAVPTNSNRQNSAPTPPTSSHAPALGGPRSTRASTGNIYALSQPTAPIAGNSSGAVPTSESMERTRQRSGSGGSLASLTQSLRGLRRPSVSQAVSAAVGEGSPLRWVAEMVGWGPEEGIDRREPGQGHGQVHGPVQGQYEGSGFGGSTPLPAHRHGRSQDDGAQRTGEGERRVMGPREAPRSRNHLGRTEHQGRASGGEGGS